MDLEAGLAPGALARDGASRLRLLGSWRSMALVVAAALGAGVLLVIAVTWWGRVEDEGAYWTAASQLAHGLPIYEPGSVPASYLVYWYPPPLAQVLQPVAGLLSIEAFSGVWIALLLACLVFLAGPRPMGQRILVALALVLLVPVGAELRIRNIHLVLAVLVVLAVRRWPILWVPAIAFKVGPIVGLGYLAASRQWRALAVVAACGAVALGLSVALAPDAWGDFVRFVATPGAIDGRSYFPLSYGARLAIGAVIATAGGWVTWRQGLGRGSGPAWLGETLLVVGVTAANPTIYGNALSILVAGFTLAQMPAPRRQAEGDPGVSPK